MLTRARSSRQGTPRPRPDPPRRLAASPRRSSRRDLAVSPARGGPVVAGCRAEVGRDGDVLEDRELAERPRDLERPRDPPMADRVGREAGDLLAAEPDGARRARERPRDAVEGRGLSRAVRPDEPEDLAVPDPEGDRAQRREAAEALR